MKPLNYSLIFSLVILSGCASFEGRAKKAASVDFKCDENKILVHQMKDINRLEASGCGKTAMYFCSAGCLTAGDIGSCHQIDN